jgi:hypothetical protein
VIEPHAIETVFEREDALDFVRLDHRDENVAHGITQFQISDFGFRISTQVIRHGKDRAEVVRRMPPLGGEPGVIEIQPADERADIERCRYGIEDVFGSRHPDAVWHDGSGHERSEQFSAGGIFQREQAAAQCIKQAIARGIEHFFAGRIVIADVIGDLAEQGIERRTIGGIDWRRHGELSGGHVPAIERNTGHRQQTADNSTDNAGGFRTHEFFEIMREIAARKPSHRSAD